MTLWTAGLKMAIMATRFTTSAMMRTLTSTAERRLIIMALLILISIFVIIVGLVVLAVHLCLMLLPLPPPPPPSSTQHRRRRLETATPRQSRSRTRPSATALFHAQQYRPLINAFDGSGATQPYIVRQRFVGAPSVAQQYPPTYYTAVAHEDEQLQYEQVELERQQGANDTRRGLPLIFDLVMAFFALIGSLAGVIFTIGSNLIAILMALAPTLGLLLTVFLTTAAISYNSEPVMSAVHDVDVGFVRPIMDYIIMPLASLGLMAFQVVYAVWLTINRTLRFLTIGPVRLLFQCTFGLIPDIVLGLGNFAKIASWSLAYWVIHNPLNNGIPLKDMIQALTDIISLVSTRGISCACNALNYVVGGLLKNLNDPMFALAIDFLGNAVLALPRELLLRPLMLQARPSVNETYTYLIQGTVALSYWLQNTTTCQVDIWIYNGNGTLVRMVNGTQAMPTDDLQYLVRFLQSDWIVAAVMGVYSFTIVPIFQIAFILLLIDWWFVPAGRTIVWNLDWQRQALLLTIDALHSFIDTLGTCNVANTDFVNIPIGQIATFFAVIVWILQVIVDIIVGEFYTTFIDTPSQPFFYFMGLYLLGDPHLQELQWVIFQFAQALGCTIAQLDGSLGLATEGLAQAVVFYLPLIPAQIIAFTRVLIVEGDVDILDAVSTSGFEQALNQTAALGRFWFQFQRGATEQTCAQGITFFCSLGVFNERVLSGFFRLLILAVHMLIWLLKVIIGSIQTNTFANATIPNFDPALADFYSAGCRLGMALALVIPLDMPCMRSKRDFCVVKEFPSVIESTPSVCLATTACKVGNILVVPLDIFFTALRLVTSLQLSASPLLIAIRQFLNVIVFRILSPICPLAHFFDCIFDLLLNPSGGPSNTPATSFFCLITGAMVYLLQTVGDIILQWIDFFITVIIGLLTGISGDKGSWLLEVLKKFFTLIGGSLTTIGEAILKFILSVFMSIVVGICWAVNVFIFFSITDKCKELEVAVSNLFGGSSQDFFSPLYVNYKRDNAKDANKCSATSAQFFANLLFRKQQKSVPSTFTFADDHYDDGIPLIHAEETCPNTANARVRRDAGNSTGESRMSRLLRAHFGTPPNDPEWIPTYLANRVYWEPTSECASLFKQVNNTRSSALSISDKLKIAECVKLKTMAIVMRSYSLFNWLPEDTFYNPLMRLLMMGAQFMKFLAVALNYILDHAVPTKMLLSIDHQQRWADMFLDVTHYATLKDAAQPDLDIILPATELRIAAALEKMTLPTYLRRNFPALYDTSQPYKDPIMESINKTFSFVTDFTNNIVDNMYNQTLRDSAYFANYTNSSHYWGNLDYANRSALLDEFGLDVMRAADVRFQTLGMYNTLSGILTAIITWIRGGTTQGGHTPYDKFRDMLIEWGNSMPTIAKRSIDAPFAIYDAWDNLTAQTQEHGKARTRAFYDSPAFHRSPSITASIVAAIGDLYVRSVALHPAERIPPWCAVKAAQLWNVTYTEARDRLNVTECENITLWQVTKQQSQNIFDRTRNVFKPRTPEAAAARETVWQVGADISNSLWRASHVFMGDDKTMETFGQRINAWSNEIKSGKEFKRPANYYNEQRLAKIREEKARIAKERTFARQRHLIRLGIDERNILNSDFLMWQKMHGNTLRDVHRALLGILKSYLTRTERAEKQRQTNFELRLRVEAKHQLRTQNMHVLSTKEEFERMVTEQVAAMSVLSPIFNNTILMQKQCSNLTSSFCETCYFAAVFVDLIVDRLTYFIVYFSEFFILVAAELSDTIYYSLDNTLPVRTGRDGMSDPWFPILGEPVGLMFQWSNNEINNGIPSLTLWLENVIGGTLPDWLSNGPCQQQLNAYVAARDAGGSSFQRNPGMDFYDFAENTLGIPVCRWQDTALFILTDRSEDIALYAFDHLVQCNYLSEIDCTQQQYSFSGGLFVTLVWIGAPITVFSAIFPMLAPLIIPVGVFVAWIFHTIITYNWSAWCFAVPPQCEPIQAFRLATLTIAPKCSPWLGGFVTNATYSKHNCYDPTRQWQFARCTDEFQNMFDNFAYFNLWWGTDFGLGEFFGPIYASLFGSASPTNTFPGWNTQPEKFRVYGACSLLTIVPWLAIGAAATLLALALILATISAVAPVFAIMCIFLSNMLRYTVFAMADIFNIIEESIDPVDDEEEEEETEEEQARADTEVPMGEQQEEVTVQ